MESCCVEAPEVDLLVFVTSIRKRLYERRKNYNCGSKLKAIEDDLDTKCSPDCVCVGVDRDDAR